MKAIRILPLALLTMLLASAEVHAAAYERRNEALQLYQEGLFQETGTGNLIMAQRLYISILENYRDYRDVAAVAVYHLGLVNQKLGDQDRAEERYKQIVTDYVDQPVVVKLAREKLKQLPLRTAAPTRPTPVPTTVPGAARTAGPVPAATVAPSRTETADRTAGRFELGIMQNGAQAGYLFPNRLLLTAEMRWENIERRIGVRGAYLLPPLVASLPLSPYVGCGAAWVLGPEGGSGYRSGAFLGAEWRVWTHLGIGADGEYYYQNTTDGTGKRIDTGVTGTVHLKYYF